MRAMAKQRGKSKMEGLFLNGECILRSTPIGGWKFISIITSDRGENRIFRTIKPHATAEAAAKAKPAPGVRDCPILSIQIVQIERQKS